MIKGIGRQVILLTDVKSELFEQAILILRPGTPKNDHDIVKECERILNSHIAPSRSSVKINGWKIGFFILLTVILFILAVWWANK